MKIITITCIDQKIFQEDLYMQGLSAINGVIPDQKKFGRDKKRFY